MLEILKARFNHYYQERHQDVTWEQVEAALSNNDAALASLQYMEQTGGEPDLLTMKADGTLVFTDFSAESPKERRSQCYDQAALLARKKNPPKTSADAEAKAHGLRLMTQDEYELLQTKGAFDLKSSSWIQTPAAIRDLGGSLFCERRYNHVFVFHNGADSYYASRGWRGILEVK